MRAITLARAASAEGHQITLDRVHKRIHFDARYGGPSFPLGTWMRHLNVALLQADCTTPDRVAMFLAQVGAESGSFRYTEELADGSAYEGRRDLGNTEPGDGRRFKGRTYIQITGRANYAALSRWAHGRGLVPTADYFVKHPAKLASLDYIFLGPVWYWTQARNMNAYADRGDIAGASTAVQGGNPANNLTGRTARWVQARRSGRALIYGQRALMRQLATSRSKRKGKAK